MCSRYASSLLSWALRPCFAPPFGAAHLGSFQQFRLNLLQLEPVLSPSAGPPSAPAAAVGASEAVGRRRGGGTGGGLFVLHSADADDVRGAAAPAEGRPVEDCCLV
jgi:hypothetical protein